MRQNLLKVRLQNRQPCLGAWLSLPSPYSARLLSRLPLDWLAIDAEHTPLDTPTLAQMIAVIAEARGPAPIVRLAHANVSNVKSALENGAYGIITPMINTRLEAEQLVAWSRYPPLGERSFGSPYMGLAYDASMLEYLKEANQQVMVAVQIESAAALNHLDDIFSVPGIDLAFVGPADLSLSLGLEMVLENPHPRFQEAIRQIIQAGQRRNLPLGIFCSNGAAAAARLREGFSFVNITTDINAMLSGVQKELADAMQRS